MKTNIYDQHGEYTEWKNKLSFYKDELKIMQERLDEVNRKNTASDIRKDIEHYQNQFIIQEKNIHDIGHHLDAAEKKRLADIQKNPVASDHRKTEDPLIDRDMVKGFETNFNHLRKEFASFVSKWF